MSAEKIMHGGMRLHLKYVGLIDSDIEVLREVRPLVEARADEFLEHFYAHLKAFEGTRAFLADENVVRRLLLAQRGYLLSLFDAQFDAAYYASRRAIGQTHFRLGLDFKWYIGAYVLYLDFFAPLFQLFHSGDVEKVAAVQSAFRKAALLDMSIVLEAYHEGDKAALESSRAQVIHQEKLAAVGLLASGLAHEIGNPLASIQAVCDNQLRKPLEPQTADKFKRIREQVMRITNIVRQLVGFARPVSTEWQPVNINAVIESALMIAKLSRSAKTVSARLVLDSALPPVNGNADQLAQVFLNLFLNAIDAMQQEGGELVVRTELAADRKIAVSIQDNGCGIPGENISKLFTPFFTTKEPGKGTGLGLHVSIGIVQRHSGEIRVDSKAGQGSTFTVELPISKIV